MHARYASHKPPPFRLGLKPVRDTMAATVADERIVAVISLSASVARRDVGFHARSVWVGPH